MRMELLPVDPAFCEGVQITVSEPTPSHGGSSLQVAATHVSRPGIVLRQGFVPPAGCSAADLIRPETWAAYLPQSWVMMVSALWASGPDAFIEVETFEDAPVSIGAVRAEKSQNATDWTPREMLVDMLREIDKGEREGMDILVACWRTRTPQGHVSSGYSASSPDLHSTLGVLARAEWAIQQNALPE